MTITLKNTLALIFLIYISATSLVYAQQTLNNTVPYFKPVTPINEKGKWTGTAGGGLSLSRGNSNSSQLTLKVDLLRTRDRDQLLLRGLIVRAKNQGVESANSGLLSGRYERNFDDDWFTLLAVDFERDLYKDLTSRYSLGPGLGYRLIRNERNQLDIYGGVAYTVTNNIVAADNKGMESFIGNEWSYTLSDSAIFRQRWAFYPQVTSSEGNRSLFEMTVTSKLISGLGLQVSLLHKYRGQVPGNEKKSDVLFFTGVTAKF